MTTEPNYTDAQKCPECGGAGVYPKINIFPPPSDVTCRMCGGSGRSYSERQAAMQWQGGDRCPYCDNTGDVHGIDGEWRGECTECKPPQPVRSVSEEDVLAAMSAFNKTDKGTLIHGQDDRDCMRAALEHFAAIAQEK